MDARPPTCSGQRGCTSCRQGKQSEGVTAAQAAHLADMRAISFSKLNIDKPETPRG
ncbi:MAG TPA: hypothetical protein VF475_14705 [Sphingobium sp.]